MRRRTALSAALAVAVVAGLVACLPGAPSASPSAPASESGAPSISPTPDPAPGIPQAATITISTEHITVADAAGATLASFDYFQPTAEVVTGLSGYLGAPTDTAFTGGGDAPPATYHDWGGLRLVDTVPAAQPPHFPEHWVRVTGTDAGGVALRAVDGSVIGGALDAVVGDATDFTNPSTGLTSRWIRLELVELPAADWSGSEPLNFATAISGSVDANRIDAIIAPSANFGA